MSTAALNNLWTYLQGLSMSHSEMLWLRDRIDNSLKREKNNPALKKSKRVEWLHNHPIQLSDEDLKDERTQYILSK